MILKIENGVVSIKLEMVFDLFVVLDMEIQVQLRSKCKLFDLEDIFQMGCRCSYILFNVFLNMCYIGQFLCESIGVISFSYDCLWFEWENILLIFFFLLLCEDWYIGVFVMVVFDNLFLDNDEIRCCVVECVGVWGIDVYSLLLEIGCDCIGVFQFLLDGEEL